MKVLSGADAFLVNGAGMEAFLPEITRALPSLPVIEASEGIELLENGDAVEILESEEEEVNSHLWLDPSKAARMAENLAAGLIRLMPADEEVITANLQDYRSRLESLDRQLRSGLENLPRRDIVTFHEAFPYFAAAYDLHVVAVVNKEPGEVLTPSQMAVLVREIIRLGNPPLFVEPQYTDLSAQTLSRETGSSVWSLDPMVTGPEEDVPLDYYETVMLQNMNTLIEALSVSTESVD
jgi:zinc transport system substrate-binding protein